MVTVELPPECTEWFGIPALVMLIESALSSHSSCKKYKWIFTKNVKYSGPVVEETLIVHLIFYKIEDEFEFKLTDQIEEIQNLINNELFKSNNFQYNLRLGVKYEA